MNKASSAPLLYSNVQSLPILDMTLHPTISHELRGVGNPPRTSGQTLIALPSLTSLAMASFLLDLLS